ncbi:MAG: ARMT1-like domain-containing protein [Phycisphaerae bacterium]|nr:ARMT1-like domain-containing protein [Tepidisphaeraceae bacterium]
MFPFIKLKSPDTYVACNWNLSEDVAGRTYWVSFFKRHLPTFLDFGMAAARARGCADVDCRARAAACATALAKRLDAFDVDPARHGRVSIVELGAWRNELLWGHGFDDCFVDLKDRANEAVLPLLPTVCRQLDALDADPAAQLRAVIEGVFAGNLFDMGAEATAKQFANGDGPDFFATRAKLPNRPWLVDDYDALATKLLSSQPATRHSQPGPAQHSRLGTRHSPYRHCIFFIDNAGSDFLLGAIPMIRYLARRGTRVTIAANEKPTLNDMTVHDVKRWWPRILEAEPSLATLPIDLVSTGTGEPLIDLSKVSEELNAIAADADLVILEGMGRGVESNLDAAFTCDALNLAILKDPAVTERLGGKMYDVVCRFR